jgi:hypothetical protein
MIYPTLAHFRHLSSLFTNLRSTPVENVRQISPFYAKQSQSQVRQIHHKLFYSNEIRVNGQLVKSDKQSQNKPNLSQNKPNSNPIALKPKMTQSEYLKGITKKYEEMGPKKQSQFKPNFKKSLSLLSASQLFTANKTMRESPILRINYS